MPDKEIKASVILAPELHAKLVELARRDGRSLSRYIAKQMEAVVARRRKRASQ